MEGFGPGNGVTATAGGDITIQDTVQSGAEIFTANNPGSPGGDIVLTTGSGGTFTLNSGANGQINSGVETGQSSGNITISADTMVIDDPITTNSSSAGIVSLIPVSFGTAIDLGANANPNTLNLTQADLNEITAGILRVRSAIGTNMPDSITITGPITDVGTGWSTLSLITSPTGTLSQDSGATLTVANLQAAGLASVTLDENNVVADLAGTSAGDFSFVDAASLAVDNVDNGLGLGFGIGITAGNVDVSTTDGDLTVNQNVTSGSDIVLTAGGTNSLFTNNATIANSGGTQITIMADRMALGTPGTSALTPNNGGDVILEPVTSGQLIDLGSTVDTTPNTLELSNTELATVTTGSVLVIGNAGAGDITVSAPISITNVDTLQLLTNGGITNNPSTGTLSVANLSLLPANAVSLTGNNAVATLAASVTNAGQAFSFTDSTPLTIGSAGGISGITTNSGNISLNADSMVITAPITTGSSSAGIVTLNVFTAGLGIDLGTNPSAGKLGLAQSDLDEVTAGVLQIGDVAGTDASITVTAPITDVGTGWNTLELFANNSSSLANTISQTSGASLTVTNLALSSFGGIGTSTTPLITQVSNLVAQMTNFFATGLFISNTGTLTIGFPGDPFQGVQTNGNGGPLDLTNAGTLNITTSGEIVTTNGAAINLTTTAGGDIVTGGGNGFQVNIGGTAGLATLNAAGDLVLGTNGLSGDVAGAGPLTLIAGGNITVDNGSVVEGFGPGNGVTATAGGDITIQDTVQSGAEIITVNNPGSPGGDIVLTTGSGGTFTLNSGANGQINSGVETGQSSGNITIDADNMVIADPITTGSNSAGIVTLNVVTAGRGIDLGTNPSAGKLGLAQSDLSNITTGVLRIGSTSSAGNITVTASITAPAGWGTLDLLSGGTITENASTGLQVPNLAAQAAAGVTLNDGTDNKVTIVAGLVTTASAGFNFDDSTGFSVGTVDGVSGISTQDGPVQIDVSTDGDGLTVASAIASGGGAISLDADGMSFLAPVNAGAGQVTLDTNDTTRSITLGGTPTLSRFAAVDDNTPSLDIWTLNNATGALLTGLGTTNEQVVSTVPSNGDQNPYGLAFAPANFPTTGTLQPGDALVANFNNSQANGNTQGLGTTIVRITPTGQVSTFFTSTAPGLSNALGILQAGFVIVGNVPNAGAGAVGAGELQVLDSSGNVVNVPGLNGPLITDPWDLTIDDQGSTAQVYVSNVSGTAGTNGTVVRIDLSIAAGVITVVDEVEIGSGYPSRPDSAAFVVGPSGLALDTANHTLYVASQDDMVNGTETGTIFSIPNADTAAASSGEGTVVFADPVHLHGPMGLLLAPNGDLIVADSDAVNTDPNQPSELVEFTPAGQFVTQFSVDPANGGAFNVALDNVPTTSLFLGQTDLNEVTAGAVQIGSSNNTGGITVAGAIAAPTRLREPGTPWS